MGELAEQGGTLKGRRGASGAGRNRGYLRSMMETQGLGKTGRAPVGRIFLLL